MLNQHTALVQDTGGPRTRRTDPTSSHVAADRSGSNLHVVADAVLWLIDRYGPMNGTDLNDRYMSMRRTLGWPVVSYESPRKRAGELVREGLLVVLNPDDVRGTPHVYDLTRAEAAA